MVGKLRESDIIRIILEWFRLQDDFWIWRNNNHGVYDIKAKVFRKNPQTPVGAPDLTGLYKPTGQFIGIEVKTKIGVVSEAQDAFLTEIKNFNGISFVTRSLEDCQHKISRIREAYERQAHEMGLTDRWKMADTASEG